MLTLKQIKTLFKSKKLNHAQLSSGTFLFDEEIEWDANDSIVYPLMGVEVDKATLNGVQHIYNFNFVFADLVTEDKGNKDDVISDMHRIALDIYSQIRYDLQNYYNQTVSENVEFERVINAYNDDVFGWKFTLSIIQDYDRSTCDNPDTGANAGMVKIVDQYGNVLDLLNPNTTYTVEVLQQLIQTLTDLAPATIIQTLT